MQPQKKSHNNILQGLDKMNEDKPKSQFTAKMTQRELSELIGSLVKAGIPEIKIKCGFTSQPQLNQYKKLIGEQIQADNPEVGSTKESFWDEEEDIATKQKIAVRKVEKRVTEEQRGEYLKSEFSLYEEDEHPNQIQSRREIVMGKNSQWEVREVVFNSFQLARIFVNLNVKELRKMEIEYQYHITRKNQILRIYIPQGEELNTFFKNQLLDMKICLNQNIFFTHNQTITDKIRFSEKYREQMRKKGVVCQLHFSRKSATDRYYYVAMSSKTVNKYDIVKLAEKHLLDYMQILSCHTPGIRYEFDQIFFDLTKELLKKSLNDLAEAFEHSIEINSQIQSILFHSRHSCFDDAFREVNSYISNFLYIRLQGNSSSMRALYNVFLRTKTENPVFSCKLEHKSLFYVIDKNKLADSKFNRSASNKNLRDLLSQYFSRIDLNSKVTVYLKREQSRKAWVEYLVKGTQNGRIYVSNFQNTDQFGASVSIMTLRLKQYSEFTEEKYRNSFHSIVQNLIFDSKKAALSQKRAEKFLQLSTETDNTDRSFDRKAEVFNRKIGQTAVKTEKIHQVSQNSDQTSRQVQVEIVLGSFPLKKPEIYSGEQMWEEGKRQKVLERFLKSECSHTQSLLKYRQVKIFQILYSAQISSFVEKTQKTSIFLSDKMVPLAISGSQLKGGLPKTRLLPLEHLRSRKEDDQVYLCFQEPSSETYIARYVMKYLN